jgi:SAM-dependent methyltransferase
MSFYNYGVDFMSHANNTNVNGAVPPASAPFPDVKSIFLFAMSYYIAKLRFNWYVKVQSRLQKFAGVRSGTAALDYSKAAFINMNFDTRIFWPMFALCSAPDLKKDSLLILGPRFETEIFLARAIGFSREGIVAIDTFTYSPLIQSGDMHALPFQNESLSAVICGWTLSYSLEPSRAAEEMSRVLKPGGYIVLAVQKVAPGFIETIPGVLSGEDRIQTLQQFDNLFSSLERVVGFEPHPVGTSSHTLACYRKPTKVD